MTSLPVALKVPLESIETLRTMTISLPQCVSYLDSGPATRGGTSKGTGSDVTALYSESDARSL